MRTRSLFLVPLAVVMAIAVAACGSDDSGNGDGGASSETTQAASLDSCSVLTPAEVDEALGVTGATPEDPVENDCLWDADQESSILNTKLDPPVEKIDLSVLIDGTSTITVPGGDQAIYDSGAQCLEGVKDDQRLRICVFGDGGGDPQAAAESLWSAAAARL